uniref:Kinesin motor domain-containing protein n=1 Tax=Ditylum brightwellii TaxID=49249 RepID=A0A7S4R8S0_9STRA
MSETESTSIQVAVRIRPFLPIEAGSKSCVEVLPGPHTSLDPAADNGNLSIGKVIRIGNAQHKSNSFTFDHALSGKVPQSLVFATCVLPLLESCINGYNATTIAYGQTGAGKTYSILGPATSAAMSKEGGALDESIGIIPRALRELFVKLSARKRENTDAFDFEVRIQFLELYGEEIRDLLGPTTAKPTKLAIRDAKHDAEVVGATEVCVTSPQDAMLCLTRGMLRRVTGATAMNAESSRSHAILTVIVEQKTKSATAETTDGAEGAAAGGGSSNVEFKKSKFNFVDLAGAERQKRTGAKGQRAKEGIDINKGLLVLGNVISALGDTSSKHKKFVPFRDSKLTRLLRGSLGGNHKTLMIACVSPSAKNLEESLNCLRYANRAKNIKNKAEVNVDPQSRMLNELRNQVKALAGELIRFRGGETVEESAFTEEVLRALAGGTEHVKVNLAATPTKNNAEASSSSSAAKEVDAKKEESSSDKATNADGGEEKKDVVTKEEKESKTAAELERVRESLRKAEIELSERSDHLRKAMAERDEYRNQLEATTTAVAAAEGAEAEGAHAQEMAEAKLAREEAEREDADGAESSADGGKEEEGEESEQPEEKGSDEAKTDESAGEDTGNEEGGAKKAYVDDDAIKTIVKKILSYQKRRARRDKYGRDKYGAESENAESTVVSDDSSMVSSMFDDDDEEEDFGENETRGTLAEEDVEVEEEDATPVPPPAEADFATALYCTGVFLVDHEEYEDSLPCFLAAQNVRREIFGWDHPSVGDALHMEGIVCATTGDHDRATLLLYDALRIRKIENNSLKVSATLRAMGDLHVAKREYLHAELFYDECLRDQKSNRGYNDKSLPDIMVDLARVKIKLGEHTEAMKYFDEALDVRTMTLGPEHPLTASLHYEIGQLAFQVGDCEHGERSLDNFIQLRKRKGQENDFLVGNAFFTLGTLYAAKKQKDSAKFYWTEALQIYHAIGLPDDHPCFVALQKKIKKAAEQNDDKNRRNLFGRKKSITAGSDMRSGSLHGSSSHGSSSHGGKKKDSLPGRSLH